MRTRSEAKAEHARRREKELEAWQIEVPNDPINEMVLLAAMALDPEVRRRLVRLFKTPDVFFAEKHRAIFAAHAEMDRRGLDYDPAVLARFAPDVDVRFIEQLSDSRAEVPKNLDYHVDTLLWDNKRAEATEGPLASLIAAIQNPRESPDRVRALGRALGRAFEEAESRAPHLRDPKEVVREMMAGLRARIAGEAYYPYGIEALDYSRTGERRLRPGAAPGLLTVLTGMSGSGKTTLSAHGILGVARQRRRVLVGAWEVRAPMTMELVTTLSLKWSRSRVLDGKNQVAADAEMSPEELVLFEERAHEISKWITFVENPFRRGASRGGKRPTNDLFLDVLRDHIEASGCEVAVFDLFDRCLIDRAPNDEQEALWYLLEMLDEQQVHGVAVHQQNLKGDNVRGDNKPSLRGLKGSSAYVDAGATIIAPHIPARFKSVPDDKFEVYGLKQRFSAPFGVEFDWDPDTGQIWGGRDFERDELFEDGERENRRDGDRGAFGAKPKRRG